MSSAAALRTLAICAVLLALLPAAGREDAAARDAARAFLRSLQQPLGPGALLSLRDLAAFDHAISVDALLEVLDSGDPCLRPTARRVLAGYARQDSLERLLDKGLGHKQASVRAQTLDVLSTSRSPNLDWVAAAERSLDDKDGRVRAAAVSALGRARRPGTVGAVLEAAADSSERVRAEAAGASVRLAGSRAFPLLEQLSRDAAWRVRLSVIQALTELRTLAGAELLVEMLGHEQGRLREDLQSGLVRLTGRNYGISQPAWSAFLQQAPPDFLALGDAAVTQPLAGRVQTVARYYGLGTASTRFALVTDLSTSMDHVDPGRYARSPGSSRLAATQTELTQLLEGLGPEVHFNLLTFSDKVSAWSASLLPADSKTLSRALREVSSYRTIGGTNLFSALEAVFDLADAEIDGARNTPDGPDTVFVLTDGAPSQGLILDVDLLLEYAAERNRSARIRFHCVALTQDASAKRFLEELATRSGGQSVTPLD